MATTKNFNLLVAVFVTLTAAAGSGCGSGGPTHASPLHTAAVSTSVTALTVLVPSSGSVINNQSSLTISGTCASGSNVVMSGDVVAGDLSSSSLSQTCSGGVFSYAVNKSADGLFSLTLTQSVSSGSSSVVWIRDTVVPTAPSISNPASNPFVSSGSSVTFAGACETGATISITGALSQTQTCASSSYSFTDNQSTDGIYTYTITQTDTAGNVSSSSSFQWTRSSSAVSVPTITTPASNPFASNSSTLTIAGACVTGYAVALGGASAQSVTCASSAYSFSVSKSSDASYSFTVAQTNPVTLITSSAAGLLWTRDTAAPAAPTITTPASNPFTSNSSSLTIGGACETGALVSLAGDSTQSSTCVSSSYSFSVTKSSDATYNFTVAETDAASNTSASAGAQWIRLTTPPAAPVITSPGTTPYDSNGSTLTLSGSCATGNSIALTGSSSQSMTCAANAFSFSISETSDGTYNFSVTQTHPLTSLTSSAASLQWRRDTVAPSAPALSVPSTSPFYSNGSALTLTGSCENSATVTLSGGSSQTATCSSGAFSFSVTKSVDATYNFTVLQTDLAGNDSGSASQQWIRDTGVPSAPTITSPAASPYTGGGASLTISGGCENGARVDITGASTQNMTCASSTYSFSVSASVDGTYNYSVAQTDLASNVSGSASQQWIRDTAVVPAPTITSPATTPYYSAGNSITLSGGCVTGDTVNLTGGSVQSMTCASSAYSFTIGKSSDATYVFSVTQTGTSTSSAASQTWVRDTIVPSAVTVTTPASNPYISKNTVLTLSGACETGATVELTGADGQTTTCASSAYSFNVSKSTDASYNFSLRQLDPAGNASSSIARTWTLDTTAPSAPVVTNPNSNPFTSGDSNLIISGSCETGATVAMSGSSTGSMTCASSSFSFTVNKTTDATYNFTLAQTDTATNASASTTQQWVRDASIPPTPTITSVPTDPYYSNGSSITLSGACVTGNTVDLGGDYVLSDITTPAGSDTLTCASSTYTFVIGKTTDGPYSFTITQTNGSGASSSSVSQQWVRDTGVPAALVKLNPATSPYTAGGNLFVSGTCEAGIAVNLTGDSIQSMTCTAASTFTFTVSKSVDATYNFSLAQTDLAGNTSSSLTQQWVRDSSVLPAPTIAVPAVNPYRTNGNAITLSGSCTTGLTVNMTGSSTQSVLCAANAYTFSLSNTSDATYSYALTQTNGVSTSPSISQQWIRDTIAPSITLGSVPANPNYAADSYFTFTTNDSSARLECRMDSASGGTWSTCTSPKIYSSLSVASHTFEVRSTDLAGNSATATNTFTQNAIYNTISLYHFDDVGPGTDSSSYTSSDNNTLTTITNATTATAYTTGFGQARVFSGSSSVMSCANTNSLGAIRGKLTAEAFVNFAGFPNNNGYVVVMGQQATSPNFGWEIRLKKKSNKYYYSLSASNTGTAQTGEVLSSARTITAGTWYHVAVTFSYGAVKIYVNGAQVGSGTIGTSGTSTIFDNASAFRVGAGSAGNSASVTVDEARVSQVIRYSAPFTTSIPSSPFTAD